MMGDYRNLFCQHCGRHSKHERIEPEELFEVWNEIFNEDEWRCLICGNSQTISHARY